MSAIQVNRAPVLTLWAAVVAERIGYDREEALTLGKALAGLNAQAKGRRLGIFRPAAASPAAARRSRRGEEFRVDLCGRPVPAVSTPEGVRAVAGERPIDPESVARYLESKFGEELDRVRRAMMDLAKALPRERLAEEAFALYEQFRPAIPSGQRGWGAKGTLDLDRIRALAP